MRWRLEHPGTYTGQAEKAVLALTDRSERLDQLGSHILDDIRAHAVSTGTHGFTSTTLQLNGIVHLFLRLFDFTKLFFVPSSELV